MVRLSPGKAAPQRVNKIASPRPPMCWRPVLLQLRRHPPPITNRVQFARPLFHDQIRADIVMLCMSAGRPPAPAKIRRPNLRILDRDDAAMTLAVSPCLEAPRSSSSRQSEVGRTLRNLLRHVAAVSGWAGSDGPS